MKVVIPVIIIILIMLGVSYYYVFTGIVKITSSRPPNAIVEIDGAVIGTTPIKHRLRAGDHEVRIYKDGFETWRGKVGISGLSPATISVKLRFLVRSEPAGAKFTVNGENMGITNTAIDIPPGVYSFEFRKNGYQKTKFIANIPPNVSQPLPIAQLTSAKAVSSREQASEQVEEPSVTGYGNIQVTSTPDAQVHLDGEPQGETPLTIKKVPVGSYVLQVSREGYRYKRQTVYVKKGETTKIAIELIPESAE